MVPPAILQRLSVVVFLTCVFAIPAHPDVSISQGYLDVDGRELTRAISASGGYPIRGDSGIATTRERQGLNLIQLNATFALPAARSLTDWIVASTGSAPTLPTLALTRFNRDGTTLDRLLLQSASVASLVLGLPFGTAGPVTLAVSVAYTGMSVTNAGTFAPTNAAPRAYLAEIVFDNEPLAILSAETPMAVLRGHDLETGALIRAPVCTPFSLIAPQKETRKLYAWYAASVLLQGGARPTRNGKVDLVDAGGRRTTIANLTNVSLTLFQPFDAPDSGEPRIRVAFKCEALSLVPGSLR